MDVKKLFSVIKKFGRKSNSEKERKKFCYLLGIIMLIMSLTIIYMLIKDLLKNAGVSFNIAHVTFIFMTLIALLASLILIRESFEKINGYFIFGCILSLSVLFVGLYGFQMLYFIDSTSFHPYSSNIKDFEKLKEADLMKNLIVPSCSNLMNSKYFTEYDILSCNFSLDFKSEFLQIINIDKELSNGSRISSSWDCEDNFCEFHLHLEDDIKRFYIYPIYTYENETLSPIMYIFEIDFLYSERDLREMAIDKFTLLITIITISFISVWAGVYYAKRILEEKT
ncbi:hypothetical protein KAT36_00085 [Candidatus Pacearchaeota archaeon]|nr:hypothetical protein [Candidatus Pacearchaeota archaeon]